MAPAPWSDDAIRSCPLSGWDGDPDRCRWCNDSLTGRQRRWCRPCGQPGGGYGAQHSWNEVRAAALRRDGHQCVRCGAPSPEIPDGAMRLLGYLMAPIDCPGVTDIDTHIRLHFPVVLRSPDPQRVRWVTDYQTLDRRWHLAMTSEYHRLKAERRLEVNHKTPILGRHSEVGCHHHLDGVETLCRPCHLAETARQFGHRRAGDPLPLEGVA